MIYPAIKIWSTARSKSLIDALFERGLCISYKRFLEMTKHIYDGMMFSFNEYQTFIPNHLKKSVFTVLVKDNIDLNASSNFVSSHYHGTSLSILQFPLEEEQGEACL